MGAAPSLVQTLHAMDDEQLATIIQEAYRHDPARIERVVTIAKLRHLQSGGTLTSTSAETASVAADGVACPVVVNDVAAVAVPAKVSPAGVAVATPSAHGSTAAPTTELLTAVDRTAALWTFPGHTLRELRGGSMSKKRRLPGGEEDAENAASRTAPPSGGDAGVDADGFPILSGSCGREKKYARCSVCYFRGVRCNTAHYCACCQRPVCVRPRTYPGETHPKICWNVLHVDKDMIQRVDKRRARKLHATALVVAKAGESDGDGDNGGDEAMPPTQSSGGGGESSESAQKKPEPATGAVSAADATLLISATEAAL